MPTQLIVTPAQERLNKALKLKSDADEERQNLTEALKIAIPRAFENYRSENAVPTAEPTAPLTLGKDLKPVPYEFASLFDQPARQRTPPPSFGDGQLTELPTWALREGSPTPAGQENLELIKARAAPAPQDKIARMHPFEQLGRFGAKVLDKTDQFSKRAAAGIMSDLDLFGMGRFDPSITGEKTWQAQYNQAPLAARLAFEQIALLPVDIATLGTVGKALGYASIASKVSSIVGKTIRPADVARASGKWVGEADEVFSGLASKADLEQRLDEVLGQQAGLLEVLETSPISRMTSVLPVARATFGETLGPRQVLNLRALIEGRALEKVTNKEALARVKELYPTAVTSAGRVRPEYILDDVVSQLGPRYGDTNGVELLLSDIEGMGTMRQQLRTLQVDEAQLADDLSALERGGAGPDVVLPRPMAGTPEAGVQAGALGVPDRPFIPQGKGIVTQVSMDDQLKLQRARSAVEVPERAAGKVQQETIPAGAFKDVPNPAVAKIQAYYTGGTPPRGPLGLVEDLPNPADGGNSYIGYLRTLEERMAEVVNSSHPVSRALSKWINPSVLADTRVGKAIVGYYRQQITAEQMTELGLASIFNRRARGGTATLGHILPINNEGFYGQTGKLWQDVFSNPGAYRLTPDQRALIADVHKFLDDLDNIRAQYGLKPIPRNQDGYFYIPRKVKQVGDIELRRLTNPHLKRVHAEATEGYTNGVRYDIDPRATLETHARQVFREVLAEELSLTLAGESLAPKALIPKAVAASFDEARRAYQAAGRERLRLRIPQGAPDATRLRKGLAAQRQAADTKLAQAKSAFLVQKDRYRAARESARNSEFASGKFFGRDQPNDIPIKTWRNRFFPLEDAEVLEAALGRYGMNQQGTNAFWKGFQTVGNTMRFLGAVGDWGVAFIQGVPVMAADPKAWGQMLGRNYQAFFDPTVQGRIIFNNLDELQEMARHGVVAADNELFSALRQGQGISLAGIYRLLPDGQSVQRFLQGTGRQTFGRFQAAYDTGLLVARLEMWKSMKASWVAKNGSLDELGAHIRNLTGGLDSRALGVSPTQRAVESMWLAFSPRLLRSTVALFWDALRPASGVRQMAALQTLGRLSAGMATAYVLAGLALGKDFKSEILPGLYPLNGKRFMSHEINGDWIGIGGQVRAMYQFMFEIMSTLAPGGKSLEDMLKVNLENPFVKGYMYRGAVGVNMAGGLVEGVTSAYGAKLDVLAFEDIDSLPDIPLHILKSALPFALQGRLEGEGVATSVIALSGLRTNPQTFSEFRQEVADELMPGIVEERPEFGQYLGAKVQDMPSELKDMITEDPRVTAKQAKAFQRGELTGEQATTFITNRWEEITAEMEASLKEKLEGGRSGFELRKAVQDFKAERFAKASALFDSPLVKEELEPDDPHAWDLWGAKYWSVEVNENVVTGYLDFDKRETDRSQLLTDAVAAGVPASYITNAGEGTFRGKRFGDKAVRDLIFEYEADMEALRPYWETTNQVTDLMETREQRSLWNSWLTGTRAVAARLQADVQPALDYRSELRAQMREDVPAIQALLVKWGYRQELGLPEESTSPMIPAGVLERLRAR